MGARGNSGVILSQIVRGAAEVARRGGARSTPTLARAFRARERRGVPRGAQAGRGDDADRHPRARRGGGGAPTPSRAELLAQLVAARRGGRRAHAGAARRPARGRRRRRGRRRPASRSCAGSRPRLPGEPLPGRAAAREALGVEASTRSSRATATARRSSSRARASTRRRSSASSSGSATRCSSSATATALKVHVHTDDPGAALALGTRARHDRGRRDREHARARPQQREERLLAALPGGASRAAVVAVVAGEGNRRLFESLGAERIVEGGQTMNPSTADLARGDRARRRGRGRRCCRTTRTSCMAAEQAARVRRQAGAGRPDRVDPGRARGDRRVRPGERSAEENAAAMREALAGLVDRRGRRSPRATLELDGARRCARASSSALAGRRRRSPAGADFDEVARAVVERLLAEPRDVLTLLTRRGRARRSTACSTSSPSSTRTSSSTCTRAASRTTRCCSPPSSLAQ